MSQKPLFVQIEGLRGVQKLDLSIRSPHHLVTHVQQLRPEFHGAELFIFQEDDDRAVEGEQGLPAGDNALHVHRCQRVDVRVSYQSQVLERAFGPGNTLRRIKVVAAKEFGIPDTDVGEFRLQVPGTGEQPPETTHIGTMTDGKTCRVAFDLVPTPRING
jgi:hypothetical protein